MTVYEERRLLLQRGALPAYRRNLFETLWPALARSGAHPLCFLTGLIGAPPEEAYLVTAFADFDAWQRAQPLLGGADAAAGVDLEPAVGRAALIVEESARLLIGSGVRPKEPTPHEDRRPVYGMRRFWLAPAMWPEFVRHSAEGIWPRIESQGAAILGLFHDAATTAPLEARLLTGYHGPTHWQETRATSHAFSRLPDELRDPDEQARTGRNAITLRSYVCLMTAHWPAP